MRLTADIGKLAVALRPGALLVLLALGASNAFAVPSISLSRTVSGNVYTPGLTVDVSVSVGAVTEGNTFNSVGIEETLPAGWIFDSIVSSSIPLQIQPVPDESDGVLDFTFAAAISAFPQTLVYRLKVPDGETGAKQISGTASAVYAATTITSSTTSTTLALDTTPPTLSSATPSTTGPTKATSIDFTVGFSEPVKNFNAASDVVITESGVTHTGVAITGGPSTYTVTVSGIAGNGTLTLKGNIASDIKDYAANSLSTTVTSSTVTIDQARPTATVSRLDSSPTNLNSVRYQVDFSESVNGTFTAADVTPGGTVAVGTPVVTGPTADDVYTVTLTPIDPLADGTLSISIGTAITDVAGNSFTGATSTVYTLDNTRPTATIALLDPTPTNLDSVRFSVDFSESVGSTFTAADVTVNGITSGAPVVTGPTAGDVYTVTVTPTSANADGTLTITLGTGINNTAGNIFAGATSSAYTIDNTKPSATIALLDPTPTNLDTVRFSVDFTESVGSTFTAADVTVNGLASGTPVVTGPISDDVYTVTVTPTSPTAEGSLFITIGTAINDAAGNTFAGATSSAFTLDNTRPTAAISLLDPTPTNLDIVRFSVDFSEPVAGFNGTSLTVNGLGSGAAVVSGPSAGDVYVVSLSPASPSADGTLSITLSGGISDLAGNLLVGLTSPAYTIDNTRPTATLSLLDPTQTNLDSVRFSVDFSESVGATFTAADVTVNGIASGTPVVSGPTAGDVYTVTVTPASATADGTLTITLGTAINDAAGNNFAGATSLAYTVDNTKPNATIALLDPTPTNLDTVRFSVDFTESVGSTFAAADVTVNGLASGTPVVTGPTADDVYTVTVTPTSPTAEGTLSITIGTAINDAAGNSFVGAISTSYTLDNTKPTATVSRLDASPTNLDSVSYQVTFSESVSGAFTAADVSPGGTVVVGTPVVTGPVAGNIYTVTLTPTNPAAEGTLSITIGTAINDAAGNTFSGATSTSYTFDNTRPSATISLLDPTSTNLDSVRFSVDFTESVGSTFTAADVTVNGIASGTPVVTGPTAGDVYTVTVTPTSATADGTLTITLGTAINDAAGNTFTGATSLAYTVDNSKPSATIALLDPTPTNLDTVRFSVDFTESVGSTFAAADVTVNGLASGTPVVTGPTADDVYTVIVTPTSPTAEGTLSITIGTAVNDAAGNSFAGAISTSYTLDNTKPTATVSRLDASPTNLDSVSYQVTFSESLSGTFTAADVSPGGTVAVGTPVVTGPVVGNIYTVTLTPTNPAAEGTLSITIGTAINDAAGNTFSGATSTSYTLDNTRATATITLLDPTPTNLDSVRFSVDFSESVGSTFTAADVTVNGIAAGTPVITGPAAGDVYTVTVTPTSATTDGTLTITLGAAINDAAGNTFAGATSSAFILDNTRPTAVITLLDPTLTNLDTVRFSVDFTESVGTTFTAADVTVNGLASGIPVIMGPAVNDVYTVSVTPTNASADGTLSITLGTGINDAAGNTFSGGTSPAYTLDNAPPVLNSIALNNGPTAGGTAVTLTGTGLTGVTLVSFGGTAATNVVVVSATSVKCTSPAHTAGEVQVTATNQHGTSNGLTFTYVTATIGNVGDVNKDGKIDALDAASINILLLYGGDETVANAQLVSLGKLPIAKALGDVNLDNSTDALDATLFRIYLVYGSDLAAVNNYLQTLGKAYRVHFGEAR